MTDNILPDKISDGSTIRIDQGTHNIKNTYEIDGENIEINGQGSTLKANNTGTVIRIGEGSRDITIKNIKIEGAGGVVEKKINGIEIQSGSKSTTVESVVISNIPGIGNPGKKTAIGGGAGICVREGAIGTTISNTKVRNIGWRGIEVGGSMTRIQDVSVFGQADRGISGDVQLPNTDESFDEHATGLHIVNCQAEGGPHPAAPIGFTGAESVIVDDCTTQAGPGRRGVSARNTDGLIVKNSMLLGYNEDPQEGVFTSGSGAEIRNNLISGFKYGIRMTGRSSKAINNTTVKCNAGLMKRYLRNNSADANRIVGSDWSRIKKYGRQLRLAARRLI